MLMFSRTSAYKTPMFFRQESSRKTWYDKSYHATSFQLPQSIQKNALRGASSCDHKPGFFPPRPADISDTYRQLCDEGGGAFPWRISAGGYRSTPRGGGGCLRFAGREEISGVLRQRCNSKSGNPALRAQR